jgi:hypothetical protein
MAQDCVRGTAPFRTRLDNNGQTSILAGDGYDVNDPTQTSQCLTRTGQQTIFLAGRYYPPLAPSGAR